jgi:hypothetical protein
MAGALLVALGLGLGARRLLARHAAAHPALPRAVPRIGATETVLLVPHIPGSIILDGDTDDPGWTRPPGPARTGAFTLENGVVARPYSDARLLWGDGYLYLALYAADEDIRTPADQPDGPLWLGDSFRLVFSRGEVQIAIEVSPKGVVTDAIRKGGGAFDYTWNSGAHVSPEVDGTINDAHDNDEEWVIEMAIPFESLGLEGASGESIGSSVRRCDTPKNSPRVCAAWGEGAAQGQGSGQLVLE